MFLRNISQEVAFLTDITIFQGFLTGTVLFAISLDILHCNAGITKQTNNNKPSTQKVEV